MNRILAEILWWYHRRYSGDDEFHDSLDSNTFIILNLPQHRVDAYLKDLVKRRNLAHFKGLQK